MAQREGISIKQSTSPTMQKAIARFAHRLVGKKIFIETLLFNYRGRLLSINSDRSLSLLLLGSNHTFRTCRIDIGLVLDLGLLSGAGAPYAGGKSNKLLKAPISHSSWHSITIRRSSSPLSPLEIAQKAKKHQGKVVIVKTDLYDYVVKILSANDTSLLVRQVITVIPKSAKEFRIANAIITGISDYPRG